MLTNFVIDFDIIRKLVKETIIWNGISVFLLFWINQLFEMPSNEERPASFISKLCNILRCKENSKIIYWDTELKGIRIVNQKKLEEVILPRYYRHNRFSSFVRQLNMYDFHKVHLPDHKSIFLHNQFDPKRKDQIHLIRRKVTFEQKSSSDREASRRGDNLDQKQNSSEYDAFFKSSKNYLIKPSIPIFSELGCTARISEKEAMDELVMKLAEFKEKKEEFETKLKQFKKDRRYRNHLKMPDFVTKLYTKLQIGWEQEVDRFQELSIEEELVYRTKRSLAPKSLKFVQSGPLYSRRETIGNFLNI